MKKFHLATWIGLALNFVAWAVIVYFVSEWQPYYSSLGSEEQLIVDVFSSLRVIMALGIGCIVISLLIFNSNPKVSIIFAFGGAIIFIPLGLVFLSGYLYDYNRQRFSSLQEIPARAILPYEVLLKLNTARFNSQIVIFIAIGVALVVMHNNIGSIIAAAGIVRFFNIRRTRFFPVLAIVSDKLLFTANMYAQCYEIPLANVTLVDDRTQFIKLAVKNSEGLDYTFRINKKDIIEDERNNLNMIISRLQRTTSIN